MKKIAKWIGLTIAIIAVFVMAVRISEYYSLISKNTRNLEMILSENITSGRSENGNLKDLITLNYDKMYVFEPYQSIDEMEKQIGFKYSKLKEGISEGIINILLVKDNKAIAYLFGYPSNTGYYLVFFARTFYIKLQVKNVESCIWNFLNIATQVSVPF